MWKCGIIFGIPLLSIFGFALAAPLPAQYNGQTCVNLPNNVITVAEKRGDDDLVEKLTAHFEKLGDPSASSSSTLPAPEHESSSSPPLVPERESTSDAQTSSLQPPGSEHGPMKDDQAPRPAPELVPSTANPNPLVEPPNPLSTEPSTHDPVSTGPSSYEQTNYGSGDESAGTHVSQEPHLLEWDHPDHMHQPDSPSPPSSSSQHQYQQDEFAHDAVSTDSESSHWLTSLSSEAESMGLPSDIEDILAANHEWMNMDEHVHDELHVHQPAPPPQQDKFAHGDQMDDAVSTNSESSHWLTSLSSEAESMGLPSDIEEILAANDEWMNMDEPVHDELHVHQPAPPLLQQDEFAHETQVEDVHQPLLPQDNSVDHGTQVDDGQQQNPEQSTKGR